MVTSIKDLQKYADGIEVELPGFVDGEPFCAKLRRLSLMDCVCEGKIPNPLLPAAAKLFDRGTKDFKSGEDIKDLSEILTLIAKSSLVSPTWTELERIGLKLTDQQLMYIYNYSQTGVDALKRFREQQTATAAD
ncbi:MAG: esterase [Clostridiales bacterium]|jgi:hypothetical protein|nr:esterase [Clostridiales bacterium]